MYPLPPVHTSWSVTSSPFHFTFSTCHAVTGAEQYTYILDVLLPPPVHVPFTTGVHHAPPVWCVYTLLGALIGGVYPHIQVDLALQEPPQHLHIQVYHLYVHHSGEVLEYHLRRPRGCACIHNTHVVCCACISPCMPTSGHTGMHPTIRWYDRVLYVGYRYPPIHPVYTPLIWGLYGHIHSTGSMQRRITAPNVHI